MELSVTREGDHEDWLQDQSWLRREGAGRSEKVVVVTSYKSQY